MSNQFAAARDELQAAIDFEIGAPQTAKVDGKTVPCIICEMTTDEILIAGGDTNSAGFRLENIPIASLVPEPKKGVSVEARGKTLKLLTIIERNAATYEITAGSLVRGEG